MFRSSLRSGQEGFSLLESLVSLAISGMIMAGLMGTLFQINIVSRIQGDSMGVAGQVQNAMAVLNHDLMGAAAGTVVQEDSSEAMVLLKPHFPEDSFGTNADVVTQTVTYRLTDGALTRDDGSGPLTVARSISSVDFGPTGSLGFTTVVTVTSGLGQQQMSQTVTVNRRPD